MSEETHTIAAIVENQPGVLFKVSNLFRRKAFNIESITVGPIEPKDLARMTITVKGDKKTLDQVVKQLDRLVDVVKVKSLSPNNTVMREMALVKIDTQNKRVRSDVIQYANIFRGQVVDVCPESLVVQLTGDSEKIDAFIDLMKTFGIKELARTGVTALTRGSKTI